MNPNVPMFLQARANARAAGDHGLEASINADLDRLGYQDPPDGRITTADGHETTVVTPPERAVPQPPKPKPPRKPRPRA